MIHVFLRPFHNGSLNATREFVDVRVFVCNYNRVHFALPTSEKRVNIARAPQKHLVRISRLAENRQRSNVRGLRGEGGRKGSSSGISYCKSCYCRVTCAYCVNEIERQIDFGRRSERRTDDHAHVRQYFSGRFRVPSATNFSFLRPRHRNGWLPGGGGKEGRLLLLAIEIRAGDDDRGNVAVNHARPGNKTRALLFTTSGPDASSGCVINNVRGPIRLPRSSIVVGLRDGEIERGGIVFIRRGLVNINRSLRTRCVQRVQSYSPRKPSCAMRRVGEIRINCPDKHTFVWMYFDSIVTVIIVVNFDHYQFSKIRYLSTTVLRLKKYHVPTFFFISFERNVIFIKIQFHLMITIFIWTLFYVSRHRRYTYFHHVFHSDLNN